MPTRVKQITEYQCECGKIFSNLGIAEKCCAPKYCNCGTQIANNAKRCFECQIKVDQFEWECAERRSSAPSQVLYSEKIDDYFGEYIDLIDALNDESEGYEELKSLPIEEFAREFRVYLCEPNIPTPINLCEHYEEFCDENDNLPGDWEEAERAIEAWIDSVEPNAWNGLVESDRDNG
jgi:hypothetical protein